MVNVVIIPGIFYKKKDYLTIQSELIKKGHNVHIYKYKNSINKNYLIKLSYGFNDFLKENEINDFLLIGLSQGGIIASYWNEFIAKKKCKKIISICSPYNGSYYSFLCPFLGVIDMKRNSKFLNDLIKKIKKSNTKYYKIYNPLDLVVIPINKTQKNYFVKNKPVLSSTHSGTFLRKKSIKFILNKI